MFSKIINELKNVKGKDVNDLIEYCGQIEREKNSLYGLLKREVVRCKDHSNDQSYMGGRISMAHQLCYIDNKQYKELLELLYGKDF